MRNLSDARPGMSVNLVLDVNIDKETTDVRNAVVYDIEGVNILLSQTNPPFSRRNVGARITVTYLIKEKDNVRRFGFSGKVVSVLNDYSLSSSQTVQAISVIRESDLKTYDLRMHYRVKPRSDSGVQLHIGDEKVNIIDISMGGARFSHSNNRHIEAGAIINMILTLDGHKFNLEVKTVNVWYPSEAERQADIEYVSVQFLKMDKNCSHALSGKILAIQREFLSKN